MKTKAKFVLFVVLALFFTWRADAQHALAAPVQQTVPDKIEYGFIQDREDPQRLIAVAYPSVVSDNATISTAAFTFLLPAGTVTEPAIPVAPANGSFVNITGVWTAIKITPSLYANIGFNAADLAGYDLYQLVLSPGSATPSLRADEPLHLFSFRLPENCNGPAAQVLVNDSLIQQALLTNIGANFNNQMSVSIDDAPAYDLYTGNSVNGSSISCPLGSVETVSRFFLPLIKN